MAKIHSNLAISAKPTQKIKMEMIMKTISLLLATTLYLLSIPANASLHARDLDGNLGNGHEAVYDDTLDITWLADSSLASTQTFGVSVGSFGRMTWFQANDWIAGMNQSNGGAGYLDINTWRLPSISPLNGSEFGEPLIAHYDGSSDWGFQISAPVGPNNPNGQSEGFLGSELAYHYYNNFQATGQVYGIGTTLLGQNSGSGLGNAIDPNGYLSLFTNLVPQWAHWADTKIITDERFGHEGAFSFSFFTGSQFTSSPFNSARAWAVADGDVANASPVPLPASLWLYGIALTSFVFGRDQKRRLKLFNRNH